MSDALSRTPHEPRPAVHYGRRVRATLRRPSACAAVLTAALAVSLAAPAAGSAAPLRVTGQAITVVPADKRYRSNGRYCQQVTVTITARFNKAVFYAEVATKAFVPTEGMRAISGRTVFRLTSDYGRIVCVARRGQTGEALRKTLKARSATGERVTKVLPRIRFVVR